MTSKAKTERKNVEVGLALGGLAGNNAYGAGVLQAALDCDLRLNMISCTSGQIHWVNRYLKARRKSKPPGELRRQLEADIRALKPTGVEPIDAALLGLIGKKDVFRLAAPELLPNALVNSQTAAGRILSNMARDCRTLLSWPRELLQIFPSQLLVPKFPDRFFQSICKSFKREREIGIVFNSYDFHTGTENVYLNKRARKILGVKFNQADHYRERTYYRKITTEAVRAGLWIYEYGAPAYESAIDGAYFRQVMLSELARAKTIYVARPINSRWIGPFPKTYLGLLDMKTEVNFNGSYAGERDKIRLMNRLVKDKAFKSKMEPKKYQVVKLKEFEIRTQEDFFGYAGEEVSVFDRVYKKAVKFFANAKHQGETAAR